MPLPGVVWGPWNLEKKQVSSWWVFGEDMVLEGLILYDAGDPGNAYKPFFFFLYISVVICGRWEPDQVMYFVSNYQSLQFIDNLYTPNLRLLA